MSGKMCNGPVIGSHGKVAFFLFSIALCLKVCSSPLSRPRCSVRGGVVVGFPTDEGCPEHGLAEMRHTRIFTSEKYCSVELNTLHVPAPPEPQIWSLYLGIKTACTQFSWSLAK